MKIAPSAKTEWMVIYGCFAVLFACIVFMTSFTTAYIINSAKKNPLDARIEWKLTQVVFDDRASIEKYPPSAARDTYISHTDKILGKRMVTLDEYGEIRDLGHAATLQYFKDYTESKKEQSTDTTKSDTKEQ